MAKSMDIIQLLIASTLGIIFGIITGLIPGIHINLISTLIVVNLSLLSGFFNLEQIIVFIISMSTMHTFADFIPSVIFGVPSEDTALSILPTHRLTLNGEAYKAIFLSTIGSLGGAVIAILLSIIAYFFLADTYDFIKKYIPYILSLSIVYFIFLENDINQKFWAIIITLFSGALGLLSLNTQLVDNPMLILFTGIFGIASIFYSIKDSSSSFPKQNFKIKNFKMDLKFFKSLLTGGLSAGICSITPGIGSAQAATLSAAIYKDIDSENFIILTGAINTINFILSIMTFYLIERARNGSILAVSQIVESITFYDMIKYYILILIISILSFIITLSIGKVAIKIVSKLNFRVINICLLIFLIILTLFMTGYYGLLILAASTFLGIMCLSLNVRRIHLMSVLLVPVIFNLL